MWFSWNEQVIAEVIATFLLVFVTCGAAALSASDEHRVSQLGASIAGGLIVTVMIYAVGHISGAHMNPAVTLAFAAVRRFPLQQVCGTKMLSSSSIKLYHMGCVPLMAIFMCSGVEHNSFSTIAKTWETP